ncbi:MAG TPA: hypothetical protein VHK89_01490 [Actinomycetota bacterium]|nr:hypothetical protein [Actinomycetota bacterium]
MEQGPEEIGDRPDERAEDLEKVTDRPLDEPAEGDDEARAEELQAIDPGL